MNLSSEALIILIGKYLVDSHKAQPLTSDIRGGTLYFIEDQQLYALISHIGDTTSIEFAKDRSFLDANNYCKTTFFYEYNFGFSRVDPKDFRFKVGDTYCEFAYTIEDDLKDICEKIYR